MIDDPVRGAYRAVLRSDFTFFTARCFHELNPQARLAMNWHLLVIAEKLAAVRQGKIRRYHGLIMMLRQSRANLSARSWA